MFNFVFDTEKINNWDYTNSIFDFLYAWFIYLTSEKEIKPNSWVKVLVFIDKNLNAKYSWALKEKRKFWKLEFFISKIKKYNRK